MLFLQTYTWLLQAVTTLVLVVYLYQIFRLYRAYTAVLQRAKAIQNRAEQILTSQEKLLAEFRKIVHMVDTQNVN